MFHYIFAMFFCFCFFVKAFHVIPFFCYNLIRFSGAVVCTTLVDRLRSDSVPEDFELLKRWEKYPQEIVAKFITSHSSKA